MSAAEHNPQTSASESVAVDKERSQARARMRRKLADARERHDQAYWERLRERLHLPTRTA